MQPTLKMLPNLLTAIRLSLAPPLAAALYRYELPWVAGLLSLAIATDLLDGWLARKLRACSAFGAYFDATADFALVTGAFGVLTVRGVYPAWLLLLIGGMFGQFILTSRGSQPVYDSVGRYFGAVLYGAVVALVLLPDLLLSDALLASIVVLSALSLSARAHSLLQPSVLRKK